MFLDFVKDLSNYRSRKVGRQDYVEGETVGVSTAWTSDEGYETALIDSNGAHPVERYYNKDESVKGHEKWVEFSKTANGKKIKKLGWSDVGNDKTVTLKV